jgi:hypothetical protein
MCSRSKKYQVLGICHAMSAYFNSIHSLGWSIDGGLMLIHATY